MNSSVDRRAVIFYVFAVVSLALTPLAPSQYSYVGVVLAVAYFVLGSLSWLDRLFFWRSHPSKRKKK